MCVLGTIAAGFDKYLGQYGYIFGIAETFNLTSFVSSFARFALRDMFESRDKVEIFFHESAKKIFVIFSLGMAFIH